MQVTSKHTMLTETKRHPEPYQEPPPVQAMKFAGMDIPANQRSS